MISLTDEQLAIVVDCARRLPASQRDEFLCRVARLLRPTGYDVAEARAPGARDVAGRRDRGLVERGLPLRERAVRIGAASSSSFGQRVAKR